MKIGFLGGSFNPPHSGHLNLSIQIKKIYNLHKIYWLVTPYNPLKDKSIYQPFNIRYNHAKQITQDYKFIEVLDIEQKLNYISSIKTILYLKKKFKRDKLFWIMGADSIINFDKWEESQRIFKEINIIIGDRERFIHHAIRSKTLRNFARNKYNKFTVTKKNSKRNFWCYEFIKKDNNSSTKIRQCITSQQ